MFFFHTPFFLNRLLFRLENMNFQNFYFGRLYRPEGTKLNVLDLCRVPKLSPLQRGFEQEGILKKIHLDQLINYSC